MSWLDSKYMMLVSSRLRNFKRKSGQLYNFSCPFCGDSKVHTQKARGYVYANKTGSLVFHCHNCGISHGFPKFLRQLDERFYSEYIIEKLAENRPQGTPDADFITNIKFDDKSAWESLIKLPKISSLPMSHFAWKYVSGRKIPNEFHAIFRWCPAFMAFTNSLVPGKFKPEALSHDEGRIVIPFFNTHNHFFAYTGRSLSPLAEVRYILIVLNKEENLLWGTDRVNLKKPITVVEGPIDATFLNNCIALAGSNFSSLTKLADRSMMTVVFDNEPRSIETKAKIIHAVDNGFKVVIWPHDIAPKDINAMVLAGYSPAHIEHIIKTNTFEGLEAKLKIDQWSKR